MSAVRLRLPVRLLVLGVLLTLGILALGHGNMQCLLPALIAVAPMVLDRYPGELWMARQLPTSEASRVRTARKARPSEPWPFGLEILGTHLTRPPPLLGNC